jgi:hypothetical protein
MTINVQYVQNYWRVYTKSIDEKEGSDVLSTVYKRDIRVQGELNHVHFKRGPGPYKTY